MTSFDERNEGIVLTVIINCVAAGFRFGCQATYSCGFLALVQVLRIPYGEIQVWGVWNFWSLRFISGSDCPWAGRGLTYLRGGSLQLSPFSYPTPKTFLIHTLLIPQTRGGLVRSTFVANLTSLLFLFSRWP